MATDDRKRRILEHLKRSTDGTEYISSKKASEPVSTPSNFSTPPTPTPVSQPTPPSVMGDERKRRIMTHLNISSGDFGNFSLTDEKRTKKIEEHIRKSLN